jgi:hypothetical protein
MVDPNSLDRPFCISAFPLALVVLLASLLPATNRAEAAEPNSGFLYGRVLTNGGGEYEGYLRWGRQEAFWDDLFHSMKTELPFREYVDAEEIETANRGREGKVEVWGMKIRWSTDNANARRLFIARFGDIARIEANGNGEARLEMRDGGVHEVSGYSDDVAAEIRLIDREGDERQIPWDRIDSIVFEPAPSHLDPPAGRLYGVVETREASWTGFVMWDKEECLTTDLLDGETRDGDVSLEMGRIHSIARRGSSRSIVELVDGRRLKLRGSNDVDGDNRGIMIEVAGLGRVTVPWHEFESFERRDAEGSGMAFDDYAKSAPLSGRVEDVDGRSFRGRLVIDLDESESWEMLNGSVGDLLFDIPFSNIESLEALGDNSCKVLLRDGTSLELSDGQDVSARNEGILIFDQGDEDPTYLPWPELAAIEFAH